MLSSAFILNCIRLMFYNAKETHIILHKKTDYALQTSDETITHKRNLIEVGPVNPNNKRQLWLIQSKKGGTFQIINAFTDHVLTEHEDVLVLQRGEMNKHQLWKFQYVSEQQFTLRLARSEHKYLCLHTGELVLREIIPPLVPDIWCLRPVNDNIVLNRSCFIISKDCKKLVDVPEASQKEGTEIVIYEPNYRYNQRWNIFKAGEVYVIKSHFNEMNLDVCGQKIEDGTHIIQWPSHGNINQFWLFQKVSDSEAEYRITTCVDKQLQLGHHHNKLILHRGRRFTWIIDGYLPE